jgi:hypothetical protein
MNEILSVDYCFLSAFFSHAQILGITKIWKWPIFRPPWRIWECNRDSYDLACRLFFVFLIRIYFYFLFYFFHYSQIEFWYDALCSFTIDCASPQRDELESSEELRRKLPATSMFPRFSISCSFRRSLNNMDCTNFLFLPTLRY